MSIHFLVIRKSGHTWPVSLYVMQTSVVLFHACMYRDDDVHITVKYLLMFRKSLLTNLKETLHTI